jgi:DNA (cytosine-5)-methyltransferase 1
MSPTAIDLFCGCGGLTVGLKQAGFRVISALDSSVLAIETFRMNHVRTKLWTKRIQDLDAKVLMKHHALRKGDLDLLAGCPPCQGFSQMRTLNGGRRIRDKQKDLVFEFLRFVESLLPKVVMMENVPGLAGDRRMDRFLVRMRDLGYQGEPKVLDAAAFGVPQRRTRMIYLAARGEVTINHPVPDANRITVFDVIGKLPKPGASGDPLHDMDETRSARVAAFIRKVPKDGGSRLDVVGDEQLPCHQRSNGFKDVYGRMAWQDVAPTITGGFVNPSKGRFLHPVANRCITLREGALLQGFPAEYRFSFSNGKFAIAQMIGNALPPEFIRRHALAAAKALKRKKV